MRVNKCTLVEYSPPMKPHLFCRAVVVVIFGGRFVWTSHWPDRDPGVASLFVGVSIGLHVRHSPRGMWCPPNGSVGNGTRPAVLPAAGPTTGARPKIGTCAAHRGE